MEEPNYDSLGAIARPESSDPLCTDERRARNRRDLNDRMGVGAS